MEDNQEQGTRLSLHDISLALTNATPEEMESFVQQMEQVWERNAKSVLSISEWYAMTFLSSPLANIVPCGNPLAAWLNLPQDQKASIRAYAKDAKQLHKEYVEQLRQSARESSEGKESLFPGASHSLRSILCASIGKQPDIPPQQLSLKQEILHSTSPKTLGSCRHTRQDANVHSDVLP